MGFFDNLDENLKDIRENLEFLSKKLLNESQDLKQAAKLKYEILNEKRILSDLYEKLGVHSYKLMKNENSDLDVEEIVKEIERHTSRVSSLEMGYEINKNTNADDISLIQDEEIKKDDEGEGSIIFIEDKDEGK